MAKIHGLVWLAIGAVVMAASSYIGPRLKFFFWVGLVLVAWGVFKLIVRYVTGEQPKTEIKPFTGSAHVTRCHACRATVYTTAKFCHMCGAKLVH
ncbi:MAG TPA: hypothetical protein VJH22_00225 [Candidatus Nanoarchaeia archaeon]|nr:hypothetical protein [Candidatus Nanoarchaeia archaeon]